jgi:hypothetical protein
VLSSKDFVCIAQIDLSACKRTAQQPDRQGIKATKKRLFAPGGYLTMPAYALRFCAAAVFHIPSRPEDS